MAEEQIQIGLMAEDHIDDWPISSRTKKSLFKNNLFYLSHLQKLYIEDLLDLDGIGDKAITELRDYIYSKYKFCFKHKPKEKKIDDFNDCQEVVTHLLGTKVSDWPRQIKCAHQLLQSFSKELLLLVKPQPHIYSLVWYLNKDYGFSYIKKFVPVTIIHEEKITVDNAVVSDNIEFNPQFNTKPKTLKDFLNV